MPSTLMSFSLLLNNGSVRMKQFITDLAVMNMKGQDEEPKEKEQIELQSLDLRHQASSLWLFQQAGSCDHMGAFLKGKEDEGIWKVL